MRIRRINESTLYLPQKEMEENELLKQKKSSDARRLDAGPLSFANDFTYSHMFTCTCTCTCLTCTCTCLLHILSHIPFSASVSRSLALRVGLLETETGHGTDVL